MRSKTAAFVVAGVMLPLALVVLLSAVLLVPVASAAEEKKKVLMILSNGAAMGDAEARNNPWEFAEPHHVFVMHGYVVDFVSPKGGRVPFSLDVDESDPPGMVSYTIKYEGFRDKANRTMTPDIVTADDYAAVFVGGGAGPLFDVANDSKLPITRARSDLSDQSRPAG